MFMSLKIHSLTLFFHKTVTQGSFPRVSWSGHKINHLPEFTTEVKNAWSFTSTLSYLFMSWWLLSTGIPLLFICQILQECGSVCNCFVCVTYYFVTGDLQPLTGYHSFIYWDNYVICGGGGGGGIPLTQLSSSLVF